MVKKIGKILLCITLVLLIVININIALDRNKNIASTNNIDITTEPNNGDEYTNSQNAKKSLSIGIASIFTICGMGVGSFALKRN